jgi:hypothetical protein
MCAGSATVFAQESKSAPLAKQLASALEAAKMDAVAAKDPSAPDAYVGALYLPGLQLLVVSAKYSAPQLLDAKLASKEYREVYIDLHSAGTPDSKMFVEDLGLDGLKMRREGSLPPDSVEVSGKRTMFDGEWRKQQLSEADYGKAFAAADERYAQMLSALLAQVRKAS